MPIVILSKLVKRLVSKDFILQSLEFTAIPILHIPPPLIRVCLDFTWVEQFVELIYAAFNLAKWVTTK